MLNIADLLEDVLADRPEAKFLKLMKNSVQRGSGLVKQILAFARGTGGERQPIPPRYALNEIRRILSQTLPKNIIIRTDCPPETPPLFADPTHLHQMLMNLCVNARDAMPQGGQLKISAAVREVSPDQAAQWTDAKPGSWVVLSVSDTGTGIPPEVQRRLGEAFFTTKPVGLGTGLGLSTVFSIVKSHGGF